MALLISGLQKKEESIKILEEYVLYLGRAYKRQIEILTTMNGSVFIAIAIITDISSIERFSSSKKWCSYLRRAPGISNSNETVRNLPTKKHGPKAALTLLCQSLNHLSDSSPKLRFWYENKCDSGKKKCVIRMALFRRVITEIYQMLKKGEFHHYRNADLDRRKMLNYNRSVKSYSLPDRFMIEDNFVA